MDQLKIWIILAQMINFAIMFFALKYFLGNKIVKTIWERREKLKALEDVDNHVKIKMEEAEEKSTMTLELARSKAETIEKDAQALAKKKKEKILADAEREATSMLASGRADIEKERLSMINSMKSRIISLSLRLNEKLFSREKTNKDFMEKELNSII